MTEHVDIVDPEIHEPKGVASATSNTTYVADGAGSGTWAEPEPKGASAATSNQTYVANGAGSGSWAEPEPKGVSGASVDQVYVADGAGSGAWSDQSLPGISGANSNELIVANGSGGSSWQKIYVEGWEDYNHAGSTQTMTSGVWTKILNDGAGAFTNTTYRLPGKTAIWDTSNNRFDWSSAGLALGDTVDIRFDFTVTTSTTNDNIDVRLRMANGGSVYNLNVIEKEFDVAGTYQVVVWFGIYMGDNNTLLNTSEIEMTSNVSTTVVDVNGWYVRTTPLNPIFS